MKKFPFTILFTTVFFALLGLGAIGIRVNLQAHQNTAPDAVPNAAPTSPSHHAAPSRQEIKQGGHEHSNEHEHGAIEIPISQPVPTVNLIAHPDSRQGWNLEMQVTNFQLAPEHVNQPSTTTSEGHAHLYVDGVKITRLYSNWYYLESLPPGKHEVTVGLNANGHEALMHNGRPIQATVMIEVP